MSRRTFADVENAARLAERGAVIAYAETYCVEVEGLVAKRRLTISEGDLLTRRIRAFAHGLGAGLHIGGGNG